MYRLKESFKLIALMKPKDYERHSETISIPPAHVAPRYLVLANADLAKPLTLFGRPSLEGLVYDSQIFSPVRRFWAYIHLL
jgi:hypothetical protein